MTSELLLSDEAILDIEDAAIWYDLQQKGFGETFETFLDSALTDLSKSPLSFQMKYKSVRIFYLDKFPYGIHYLLNDNLIQVIAVFHTARNPNSWHDRLDNL